MFFHKKSEGGLLFCAFFSLLFDIFMISKLIILSKTFSLCIFYFQNDSITSQETSYTLSQRTRNDLKLLTLMVLRSLPVSKVPKTIQMSNFRRFCVPSVSFDFSYLFKIFRYGTFKFKKCFSNLEVQYRKI